VELQARPWRGNVRELQNLVEHVAVISTGGTVIEPDDLPSHDDEIMPGAAEGMVGMQALLDKPFHAAKDELVSQFEQEYVRRITSKTRGNMSKAARLAGIDRTTLYRLMEKHGALRGDEPAHE
jgi:DNA-binding NtrC family response regulator